MASLNCMAFESKRVVGAIRITLPDTAWDSPNYTSFFRPLVFIELSLIGCENKIIIILANSYIC